MILVVRVATGLKTGTVLPSRVASLQDTVASLSGRDTRPVPPAPSARRIGSPPTIISPGKLMVYIPL